MIAAAVCLASAATLAYVVFGYPLLLAILSKFYSRPVGRAPIEPTVSILLAVHNGERYLRAKLDSILALDYPGARREIFVLSDGSTDETVAIAGQYSDRGVTVIDLPRGGKCAALNTGIQRANGEILVLTDVRQTLAPESLRRLLENFADPQVGAASAELVIRRGDTLAEVNTGLYWKYEIALRLRLSALDSIFGATGAYYAIRRRLASPLPEDALLDDMHLPLGAFFQGYRLIVDSRAKMYDEPTGLRSEFRRKVRTLAGNYQILRAYPQLLNPFANRLWLHFISYKFARLLLPFFLLSFLIASLFLPAPWSIWLVGVQAAGYGLAALDRLLPDGVPLKRLTSPLATFVTLMAASACAISILFVPPRKLWTPSGASRQAN